jgi:uncharacterized protein YjbI with pentapeptide repeats
MAYLTNLSFSGIDLSGLDCRGMTIASTVFSNTSLRKAKYKKNLAQYDFQKAEMVHAGLCLTNLENASFSRSKICMAKIN